MLASSHRATPPPPPPPLYYVPLPRRLLATLRDTPQALGIYALIARVYRATKAPVPLSPADIASYDPAISAAAAGRGLRRLLRLGYLLKVPSGGPRNAYRPAWGLVSGAPRPWELDAPALGRPPHLTCERLPQDLLDCYLGRLEPHALRGAHVTRYLTAPLLSLADVGAYALLQAGYPAASAALHELGLRHEGRALTPPPADELLAIITQRRLLQAESPIALSEAGWARLGLPAPPPPRAGGAPLLFVPADRLGNRLGDVDGYPIGPPSPANAPARAIQRPRGRAVPPAAGSHGVPCADGRDASTTPTPTAVSGGGGDPILGSDTPPAQGTALARLRALGVRPEVALTLAGRPLAQVERVIGQARARGGVRDLAAWVVSALRALPSEEPRPGSPSPKVSDLAILTHQGLSNQERVRWLARFRGADPADRPALLARFAAEHPPENQAASA